MAGVGAGKTVIIAHSVRDYLEANERRVVVLAHRQELIEAAAGKIRAELPGMRVGIVKAKLNQTRAPIVVGSVQTLAPRDCARARMLQDVGLVICDEAHHYSSPSWLSVLKALGCYTPGGARALGVTATMYRSDGANLGEVWQDIAFDIPMPMLTAQGWLAPLTGIRVDVEDLHLERVRSTAGDYSAGDLGRALEGSLAPAKTAMAIAEHCPRMQGLVFVPRVESAYVFAEEIERTGRKVEVLHAKVGADERKAVLDRYRNGTTEIICNVGILTEGTDLPMTYFVCIARPTKSNGLYTQMAGRAARLFCPMGCGVADRGLCDPNIPPCPYCKRGAILLDVAGVTRRVSLDARIQLFGKAEAARIEAPLPDEQPARLSEPKEPQPDDTEYRDGDVLRSEVVNLFGSSTRRWLRTERGVWFLPAKDRLIAILPSELPARYDVVAMDAHSAGAAVWVARSVPHLGSAQEAGEQALTRAEKMATSRSLARRQEPANPMILNDALRLGLTLPHSATYGDYDDAVAVLTASRRIDPVVLAMPHVAATIA